MKRFVVNENGTMDDVQKQQLHKIVTSYLSFPLVWAKLKVNTVEFVRERTIPTERPPLVGEVTANVYGYWISRGRRNGSLWPYSRLSRPESIQFHSKQLLNCTHEGQWTPFQTHHFSGNVVALGIEPGPLDL
jgi:hypothetical protein